MRGGPSGAEGVGEGIEDEHVVGVIGAERKAHGSGTIGGRKKRKGSGVVEEVAAGGGEKGELGGGAAGHL